MKLFKKLATLCLALTLCVGVGVAMTSCGDETNGDNEQVQVIKDGYTFKVVNADGSAAKNYMIQLCNEGGCVGGPTTVTNDNGVTSVKTAAGVYEIHVMNMSDSSSPSFDAKAGSTALTVGDADGADGEYPLTPASYGTLIEITLK